MSGPLPRIVELARDLVCRALMPGELAIDATVGNGHDTIWLADRVGDGGRVLGLDVQEEALRATAERLRSRGLADRVLLVRASHHRLDDLLKEEEGRGGPGAVIFNLGYLPGGDPEVTTRTETTLPALDAAIRRVRPGGLVSVVLYPGHAAGRSEADAVARWAGSLPESAASILRCELLGRRSPAPKLLTLARPIRGGGPARSP
jgi:SAM-dependent methyltransferase